MHGTSQLNPPKQPIKLSVFETKVTRAFLCQTFIVPCLCCVQRVYTSAFQWGLLGLPHVKFQLHPQLQQGFISSARCALWVCLSNNTAVSLSSASHWYVNFTKTELVGFVSLLNYWITNISKPYRYSRLVCHGISKCFVKCSLDPSWYFLSQQTAAQSWTNDFMISCPSPEELEWMSFWHQRSIYQSFGLSMLVTWARHRV